MLEKEIDNLLKELSVSSAWADDFAGAIQSVNDLNILKEAASLKDKKGNRLYDNFQLFQFLGDDKEMKLMLAKKFLQDNPEFSEKNYNMPVINYIIKNQLNDYETDKIINNTPKDFLNNK